MQRIVITPRGRGMLARMKRRKGVISGMLEVSVYAMDFFRLSNIRRPARKEDISMVMMRGYVMHVGV